jgi:hypothetical protein
LFSLGLLVVFAAAATRAVEAVGGLHRSQDMKRVVQDEDTLETRNKCFYVIVVVVAIRVTRDRCYDFKNIFAEKFGKKIGVFAQTTASF